MNFAFVQLIIVQIISFGANINAQSLNKIILLSIKML